MKIDLDNPHQNSHFIDQQKKVWETYEDILKKSRKDIRFCKKLRDMYPIIAGNYTFFLKNEAASPYRQKLEKLLQLSRTVLDVPVKATNKNFFKRLSDFYSNILPDQIYQSRRFIFASTLFFWMSVLLSFVLTAGKPEFGGAFLGSEQYHHYRSQIELGIKFQNFFLPDDYGLLVFISVLVNNLKVALLTTISGTLLGIGTIYVLMQNAFIMGGLSGLYFQSTYFIDFLSQILQHGFIELMAICLSGACGFLIATPFFYSGHIQRKDFFKKRIQQAGKLFIGCASMLFLAAAIEGFITTLYLSLNSRYLIIFLTMILFGGYLLYSLKPNWRL